jgi:hypothetical protein
LFGCLQCSLINKNAVLSVTQIRAFLLHEPLVSRLQVIVRVSCHRIEGWFLYWNEHVVSQVVVHLRFWNLQVLKLRFPRKNNIISTKLWVFFYYLLNVLLMFSSQWVGLTGISLQLFVSDLPSFLIVFPPAHSSTRINFKILCMQSHFLFP